MLIRNGDISKESNIIASDNNVTNNAVNIGIEGELQQDVFIRNGHLTEKPNKDVTDKNVTNNTVTNNSENVE